MTINDIVLTRRQKVAIINVVEAYFYDSKRDFVALLLKNENAKYSGHTYPSLLELKKLAIKIKKLNKLSKPVTKKKNIMCEQLKLDLGG